MKDLKHDVDLDISGDNSDLPAVMKKFLMDIAKFIHGGGVRIEIDKMPERRNIYTTKEGGAYVTAKITTDSGVFYLVISLTDLYICGFVVEIDGKLIYVRYDAAKAGTSTDDAVSNIVTNLRGVDGEFGIMDSPRHCYSFKDKGYIGYDDFYLAADNIAKYRPAANEKDLKSALGKFSILKSMSTLAVFISEALRFYPVLESVIAAVDPKKMKTPWPERLDMYITNWEKMSKEAMRWTYDSGGTWKVVGNTVIEYKLKPDSTTSDGTAFFNIRDLLLVLLLIKHSVPGGKDRQEL
ncbi:hypothetical protein J7J08_04535 [Stenotrophomonas sp. ISL-67]|uniref:ribosome-inactivating family protein n=1 Tax=Stenotrophomonas sp. ISL-67 TaxID=2819171 RepID=UPI001BEAF015|nr:ribosome-inactivating family protein [Stenotrophomonas sp. ISL-67]MBT2766895.1 hypothetical protein [Stenotrophomonas sp. ISL-67]